MNQLEKWATEFRSIDADSNRVTGTAAVFHKFSRPEFARQKGHLENIAPEAFTRSLSSGKDIRLLMDHNPGLLLGRTSSGTLSLRTDDEGLQVSAELPDTSYARDLRALIARGDYSGMSFGFNPVKDRWTSYKGMSVRTHTEVDLAEVSIVSNPVYLDTTVSLRSFEEFEEFEISPVDGRTQLIIARHNIRKNGGIR